MKREWYVGFKHTFRVEPNVFSTVLPNIPTPKEGNAGINNNDKTLKDLSGRDIDLNDKLLPQQYALAKALLIKYRHVFVKDNEYLKGTNIPHVPLR